MQLRQPIEGDKVLSAQNINESGHTSPSTFSLVVNNVEHVLTSINSMGYGFLSFNTPVPLKGGDTVRLKSNIPNDNYDTTGTYTVRSTNFGVTASNATICNNTSPVIVKYNDIIRVFLNDIESDFTLNLNGNPLSIADFVYQEHQTGGFTTDGVGGFKGNSTTANISALSKINYAPTNELVITVKGGYNVVRLGIIDLIFNRTSVKRSNFATGEFEVALSGSYTFLDVFKITSTNSYYRVYKNNVEIYSFSKAVSLTTTGGSISPNPVNLNTPATWTLPVSPGNQTVTAEFAGGGVFSSTIINVDFCKSTVDDKSATATRGTTNNLLPPLTSTTPTNCTNGGFRITQLPSCVILKLNSVPITLNQIIVYSDRDKIRYDVPSGCGVSDNFKIQAVATGAGCMDSIIGTVTFNLSACSPNWQNEGAPQCIDCFLVQRQKNINVGCSGGDEYRNVVLGDGSCKDAVWNTGEETCKDCQEVIKQTNTNPCFVGTQTRYIPNPEGLFCNTDPIWEEDHTLCSGEHTGIEYNNVTFEDNTNPLNPGDIVFLPSLETNKYLGIRIHRYSSSGVDLGNILDYIAFNAVTAKIYLTFIDFGFTYIIDISEELIYNPSTQVWGGNIDNFYALYRTPQNSRAYFSFSINGGSPCNLFHINIDTNPCSSKLGTYNVMYDEESCTNSEPKWVQSGELICNNCIPSIIEKDSSICSATYNTTRTVPFNGVIETFYKVREKLETAAATDGYFDVNSRFPTNPVVRFSHKNADGDSFLDIWNSIFITNPTNVRIELFNPIDNTEVLRLEANGGTFISADQEFRVNTNKIFTSPNWWNGVSVSSELLFRVVITIINPEFNLCNDSPNFQPTGNTECIDCENTLEQEDINPCSPSFGQIINVPNPSGTDCNYDPVLEHIENKCVNCEDKSINKDINPCSPTFNQQIILDLPSGTVCNLNRELEETELEKTDPDGTKYRWWINVNPCYLGEGEWIKVIEPPFVIDDDCGCGPEIDPYKTKIVIVNKCSNSYSCICKDNCNCNCITTTTNQG